MLRGRENWQGAWAVIESLYQAVFDAPADDGPRLVLADALQEQGDPRGEFISLSLQPRRTQRSDRRMAKLLERHRADFLRGLQPMVVPGIERWDRGFLEESSLILEGLYVEVPDLATLTRVEVLSSPAPPLELASRHMHALKAVSMAALSAVPVLFDGPRPLALTHVGLSGPGDLRSWPEAFTDTIGTARTLPKLERLTLRTSRPNLEDVAWLWRLPLLGRLRSLEIDGSFRGLGLVNLLPLLRSLERPPAQLVFECTGLRFRLRAADGFRSLQAELDPPSGVVIFGAMLDTLPVDALGDLSIKTSAPLEPTLVRTLREATKRLQLANLELPQVPLRARR